jgi:flagellum-specific peptidoglycan hydrolase FlgJ
MSNLPTKGGDIKIFPELKIVFPEQKVSRAKVGDLIKTVAKGYTPALMTLLLFLFLYSAFQAPQKNPVPAQGSAILIDSVKTGHNEYVAKKVWIKKDRVTNSAAPVANPLNANEYITRFLSIAQTEQALFGIPASITLGQGLIESNSGNSGIAQSCNNHFGIKCFSKHHRGCCEKWADDNNHDSFRKFTSPWYSFREHSKLLSKPHYKSLHQYGKDYKKWAYGLKRKGYATDKTYAEKLIGIIERYDLHKYD